ncbi:MAG: hypothetical protein BWY22_00647 [Bacteroidetes bacterium ADurb.Bin217]|nr:MAG: hypothetical protein BWY22_00647 [Bacteroidetes bacterium ADurb.Bin217]
MNSTTHKTLYTIARIWSWFVSIVFHPLVYGILGAYVLIFSLPYYASFNVSYSYEYLKFVGLLTYIMPLVAIPLYMIIIKILKQHVSSQHQRIFIVLSTAIIYAMSYRILQKIEVYQLVSYYILLCSLLMFISLIITYFWKISLHMIGIGGFTGVILILSYSQHTLPQTILPYCFLIAGMVGTSRLFLKAHNTLQIYVGFVTGIATSIFFTLIFII